MAIAETLNCLIIEKTQHGLKRTPIMKLDWTNLTAIQ
ncbi:hypothetical protein DFQ01_1372 [Paenibacillus cellulosilyticus]|uniref:Uncharacterized protein n=1 Tax=Paenibacillus cellulosilyticus TaxID=375489 RepID=A0A2V2YGQ7_9BACL|nr:hypothetical protein DFQ01_1372 [Paenibacillus cellulosilyticus]